MHMQVRNVTRIVVTSSVRPTYAPKCLKHGATSFLLHCRVISVQLDLLCHQLAGAFDVGVTRTGLSRGNTPYPFENKLKTPSTLMAPLVMMTVHLVEGTSEDLPNVLLCIPKVLCRHPRPLHELFKSSYFVIYIYIGDIPDTTAPSRNRRNTNCLVAGILKMLDDDGEQPLSLGYIC